MQGHHYKGYDVKNRLKITWLCPKCHRMKHICYKGVERGLAFY